jgi:hypothetical protein
LQLDLARALLSKGKVGMNRRPLVTLICTAIAALMSPIQAYAQFAGKASATAQFEDNSNVFDLQAGAAPPQINGFARSDTFLAYGAEVDGTYQWSRQQFYATAGATQFEYQHFTALSHSDYKVDGGWNWALGELLDGKLDSTRTRTMVPFYGLSVSDLTLSLATEQRETAQINLKLHSRWKIEGSGFTSRTDEPIPQAPDLTLTQSSAAVAIEYMGVGPLTSGLTAGYLSGDYGGSMLNPSFRQSTVALLADYKRYRMTFEGQAGYTHRVSVTGGENTSAFTGLLALKEQLTPKTGFTFKVDRVVNNYIPISSLEIDTDAGAGVDWQATYKLRVSLGYTFTYRAYPQLTANGVFQVDYQQYATMGINYQPQRWLLIRPYANLQTRRSNFVSRDFSANVIGVAVTASAP